MKVGFKASDDSNSIVIEGDVVGLTPTEAHDLRKEIDELLNERADSLAKEDENGN